MEKFVKQNTFKSKITGIFVFLLLTFFPLVMHEGYGDIFRAKSLYFYILTIGYILLIVSAWVGALFCNKISDAGIKIESTDSYILGFIFLVILSWSVSSSKTEQFWGVDGRNMGLFTLSLSAVVYFLIKRYGEDVWGGITGMFVTNIFVCGLTVCNHLGYDPLDVYSRFDRNTKFMSTMGNINTLSAYIGIVVPFAMVLFCVEIKRGWQMFYGLVCFCGFAGMLAANSDSAYLTVGVTGVLLLLFAKDVYKGMRLLLLLFLYGIAGAIFEGLRFLRGNKECVKLRSGIGKMLIQNNVHWMFIIVVAVLLIGLWLYSIKVKGECRVSANKIWCVLRWMCIGMLVAALVVGIGFFVYINLTWTKAEAKVNLGGLYNYLYLSNTWGTRRLRIWKAAWKTFGRLPLLNKLIGVGPAGFYYATQQYLTTEELQVFADQGRLVDAHNVYLQALVVFGAVGVLIFVGFFVSAFVKFIKKSKENTYYLAFAAVVTAYLAQAFVNNMHIYIEPFVILLMAVGMGHYPMRRIQGNE